MPQGTNAIPKRPESFWHSQDSWSFGDVSAWILLLSRRVWARLIPWPLSRGAVCKRNVTGLTKRIECFISWLLISRGWPLLFLRRGWSDLRHVKVAYKQWINIRPTVVRDCWTLQSDTCVERLGHVEQVLEFLVDWSQRCSERYVGVRIEQFCGPANCKIDGLHGLAKKREVRYRIRGLARFRRMSQATRSINSRDSIWARARRRSEWIHQKLEVRSSSRLKLDRSREMLNPNGYNGVQFCCFWVLDFGQDI